MPDPLLAFVVKLPLALAVFLLIAYAGTVSKRIAGVLLTFPILNGIAIIASPDPVRVADAIYPLVIFNCALFALLISFPQPLRGVMVPRHILLLLRVALWGLAWFAGAYLITRLRESLPGGGILLIGATIFAIIFAYVFWSAQAPTEDAKPRHHAAAFLSFWASATGLWRIALFGLAYGCLYFAARAALDEKWVGMASALPLPGLFALATLIDDAEAKPHATAAALQPMRDTVFLGPLLVIPFNWTFAHALVALPPEAFALRYLLLLALWTLAALAVVLMVPRLARYFGR